MAAGTIAGLLDECAARRPDHPLLRDVTGATLTVAEVAALATTATRWLWDAGVRPGNTVAWQLPSHVNAAVVMLALARTPVTQAPVLHLYRSREVQAALDIVRADILLLDESTADNAPAGVRTAVVPTDLVGQLRSSIAGQHPGLEGARAATDPRWVYFTSGTTGRPKGVVHTDATLLSASHGYVCLLYTSDAADE